MDLTKFRRNSKFKANNIRERWTVKKWYVLEESPLPPVPLSSCVKGRADVTTFDTNPQKHSVKKVISVWGVFPGPGSEEG